MARRSKPGGAEDIRQQLVMLLTDFETTLRSVDLRAQVRGLIPAYHLLRDLGGSLLPTDTRLAARGRILAYFRQFPGQVIDGDELMVVSGIGEYARRIRELRIEEGWPIIAGKTANELRDSVGEGELFSNELPPRMRSDQYLLQEDAQDRDAAFRWRVANQIRKSDAGVREKLLRFLRANVGKRVTSEELRYVAGDRSEWARRARELRTEDGWPVVTKFTGDPSLPMGVYVLARDEQAPAHDRHIPELTRREVMRRDDWSCRWLGCSWPKGYPASDMRFLEAHHLTHHASGGSNDADNLVTLCNLHHDEAHRTGRVDLEQVP
jgi:hypothetical protein